MTLHSHIRSAESLWSRLPQTGIGVHDGLSVLLASKGPWDFLWISSFATSATLGIPDAGVLCSEQMLATVRLATSQSHLPVVVDMDAGYGDEVKVYDTVRHMARAAAAAVVIEDSPIAKRCSLYDGIARSLVSPEEHAARIRAALLAASRTRDTCAVIARTEALVAGMGVDEALRRAELYAEAGARALFVQSRDASGREIRDFFSQWQRRLPVFLAPTMFPGPREEMFAAGATHVIFANHMIRAAHRAMTRVAEVLAATGDGRTVEDQISSVSHLSSDAGTDWMREVESALAADVSQARSAS